jgi:hypothetical protein
MAVRRSPLLRADVAGDGRSDAGRQSFISACPFRRHREESQCRRVRAAVSTGLSTVFSTVPAEIPRVAVW